MKLLRKFLFPFVPLYYLITCLRNKLYDCNILKSKSYAIPILCVGNLSVGGTGKTPMIEYLIRLLSDKKPATLSRGYKRSTQGFLLADDDTEVHEIGDEPYQFKQKFDDVLVAVDEDRQRGIERLMQLESAPDIILLDDAYQHRKVKAGLNVLLTTYDNLYIHDWLLPTGNLREPRSGAKRADIVVVTKCPTTLSVSEKNKITEALKLQPNQALFFSSIVYDDVVFNETASLDLKELKKQTFTLVTGIANAQPLVDFLKNQGLSFEHLNFGDHHNFSAAELQALEEKPLIVTTEKDFTRLENRLDHAALYYLPITIKVDSAAAFETAIRNFVP